jgi:hypothetical protein
VLQQLTATRYLVPLREGGSLPAIVDTDRGGRYVVKFRGAGQGPKALVAEAVAAGLAQALELPVPAPAIVTMAEEFGRGEPDPEIQDILRGSIGANFGLAYLPGALGFDEAVDLERVDPELAAAIVWFDALLGNVDRSPRNPNLLFWNEQVWLIDHGASLYFHHAGAGWEARAQAPFPQIVDHILLRGAGDLRAADRRLRPRLTRTVLRQVAADLPDTWLGPDPEPARQAYVTFLQERLDGPREWIEEAERARH